jgi:amidohydrolase
VRYNIGPTNAAADGFRIVVRGRQAHGAFPAGGVDPIVVGSQIVLAFQTIISRQVDLTTAPAVVTVGAFNGGLRENIIPDTVVMIGTIRTYDEAMRTSIHERMKRTAQDIAHSAGATADVQITRGYDVTRNDTSLTQRFVPTLKRVVGVAMVTEGRPSAAGEDFSRYAEQVPGLFFSLGITPPELDWRTAATNHSPLFQADDRGLPVGVRLMTNVALDFLRTGRVQ